MRRQSKVGDDIRRLDPIDGDRLAAAWSECDAKQALFEEITTMPAATVPTTRTVTVRAPRRRLRLAAGLAIAAAGLVLMQGLLFDGTPAYAVRQLPNGVLEVNVTPGFRDGDALAAELRDYGVDVQITTIVASPSLVGHVDVFGPPDASYPIPGLSSGPDGTPEVFTWTIDPAVFTERLTIEVSVAAAPGEQYQSASEVFSPGEALAGLQCALGEPLRPEDVLPYLDDLGITPIWITIAATNDPSITQETEVAGVPSGEIMWGYMRDASTVQLTVLPDGVTLSEASGVSSRLSDVPCTPAAADAWQ